MRRQAAGPVRPRRNHRPGSGQGTPFSIVSLTTIGYGDVTPSTTLGKIVAIGFGIVGIVCVALLTANIIESNSRFNELEEQTDV